MPALIAPARGRRGPESTGARPLWPAVFRALLQRHLTVATVTCSFEKTSRNFSGSEA